MTVAEWLALRRYADGWAFTERLIAAERHKLHWRERIALWLGKHVRRWEVA